MLCRNVLDHKMAVFHNLIITQPIQECWGRWDFYAVNSILSSRVVESELHSPRGLVKGQEHLKRKKPRNTGVDEIDWLRCERGLC